MARQVATGISGGREATGASGDLEPGGAGMKGERDCSVGGGHDPAGGLCASWADGGGKEDGADAPTCRGKSLSGGGVAACRNAPAGAKGKAKVGKGKNAQGTARIGVEGEASNNAVLATRWSMAA